MIKKYFISLLIIVLGGFFLFSAITKYQVIDIYEISLVKQSLADWSYVRFTSRLIIGFEIALGILLILHYRVKFLLKSTLIILSAFTVLLASQIILDTELENCFCFGEAIQLNNTESILKNAFLALITVIALKSTPLFTIKKWNKILIILGVFVLSTIGVSILYPPINIYDEYNIDTFKPNDDFPVVDSLPNQVYEGKVILAFLSSTCPHCEQAALKLAIIEKESNFKVYPVFGFGKTKIDDFMIKTELKSPYIMMDKKDFLKFTKGVFPQIYLLNNGKVKEILNKRRFIEKKLD